MTNQPEQTEANTSDDTNPPDNDQNQTRNERRAAQQTDENGWHAEEREHKRHERTYWRIQKVASAVTLIFSLIAAGGAAAGAYIAFGAFKEARRQADEAKRQADVVVSDQRPWLHLEDVKTEQINYNVNGLMFTTRFSVKNYGRSPAIHTAIQTKVIPMKFDALTDEKTLCETDYNKSGPLVFPGETPHEFPITLTFYKDDITLERRIMEAQKSKLTSIWMTMLICVQYESLYDTRTHHEGHAYNLNPVDITNAADGSILPAPNGHPSFTTPSIID